VLAIDPRSTANLRTPLEALIALLYLGSSALQLSPSLTTAQVGSVEEVSERIGKIQATNLGYRTIAAKPEHPSYMLTEGAVMEQQAA
jgi:hypothetical protein